MMIRIFTFLSLMAFSSTIFSQAAALSSERIYQTYKSYKSDKGLSPATFLAAHYSQMGLDGSSDMILQKSSTSPHSYGHHKYKQYYKDIPVYGSSYILHTREGQVISSNGSIFPNIHINTVPSLTTDEALQLALKEMDAQEYSWEAPHQHHGHDHHHSAQDDRPIPELVIIDKAMPSYSGDHKLCYKIDVFSSVPLDGVAYFVDAHDGSIVTQLPLIKHSSVPGTGSCRYYGTQDIQVDSVSANEYVLFDANRGIDGIAVLDFEEALFTSTSRDFDYSDDELGKTATDAYYCTLSMYDMLRDEFGWRGIDGENGSLTIGVNARDRKDYVNAYWNGEMAWIGNGDCNNDPLTTLDVVGHEFMHGVIDYTSNLVYREESGAINESMADVIGKMLEYHYDKDNFSWKLGNRVRLLDDAEPFRNMADPESVGDPKFYDGDGWRRTGGVHTNSSIGNLFFYYLAEGGQGVNEDGESFDVPGLGMEEAGKFIFFVNQHYLVEDSQYIDYYNSSITAMEAFFPDPSMAEASVREAWKAVGLPGGQDEANFFDLSIEAIAVEDGCGRDKYLPLSFEVMNTGSVDYMPSMDANVLIEFINGGESISEMITLDGMIAVGDTLRVVVSELLYQDEDDFIFLNYTIVVEDDKVSNNTDNDFVGILLEEEKDLAITFVMDPIECFDEEAIIEIEIENQTCTDLDAGAKLLLAVVETTTGDTLWSEVVVTDETIRGDRRIYFEYVLPIDWESRSETTVSLTYADDPNLDNNTQNVVLRGVTEVEADYINEFSDLEAYDDAIFVTMEDRPETPFDYEGETYFVTTGEYADPFSDLCFYADREFDKSVGSFSGNVSASIETCVDLSDQATPQVLFDFVEFRNAEFATDNSSGLKVLWEDTDGKESSVIIRGQEEGVPIAHAIDLPPNYKGPLEFRFVNHSGLVHGSANFLAYDITLFDNLRFNQNVSTETPNAYQSALVYPNPTTERLYVASGLVEYQMTIYDLSGKEVLSKTKAGYNVDVASLEDGYYVIVLQSGEKSYRQAFVKMGQ